MLAKKEYQKGLKNGTGVPPQCKSLAVLKKEAPKHQLRYKIII